MCMWVPTLQYSLPDFLPQKENLSLSQRLTPETSTTSKTRANFVLVFLRLRYVPSAWGSPHQIRFLAWLRCFIPLHIGLLKWLTWDCFIEKHTGLRTSVFHTLKTCRQCSESTIQSAHRASHIACCAIAESPFFSFVKIRVNAPLKLCWLH